MVFGSARAFPASMLCSCKAKGKHARQRRVVIYVSAQNSAAGSWKRSKVFENSNDEVVELQVLASKGNPATRNRTRDHLIAAGVYSQMLYQLSYSRLRCCECALFHQPGIETNRLGLGQGTPR